MNAIGKWPKEVSRVTGQNDSQFTHLLLNDRTDLTISDDGGHITGWRPAGHREVLWLSPRSEFGKGKAIRGGIPHCGLWFARGLEENREPMHGTMRIMRWQLMSARVESNRAVLTYELTTTPNDSPHKQEYHTKFLITVSSESLQLETTITNTGKRNLVAEYMLHTYFYVGDLSQVKILGLEKEPFRDAVASSLRQPLGQALTFSGENEINHMYNDFNGDCTLIDESLGRQILIKRKKMPTTVIWNPGVGREAELNLEQGASRNMLCAETGFAKNNYYLLRPGDDCTVEVTYTVTHL